MNKQAELIYNETMRWWQEIDEDWKSVFYYNYLHKRAPDLISNLIWESREIGGAGTLGNATEGVVNFETLCRHFSYPEYFVALEAKNATDLIDFSKNVSYTYNWHGHSYTISWNLHPKDSNGIRKLLKLETLHLYKEDNDELMQPQIKLNDLRELMQLSELNLHLSHCDILQELLTLHLPKLSKICLHTGMNQHRYYYAAKEEEYINFIRRTTDVKLEVAVYPD
jgi:hypothetical protein